MTRLLRAAPLALAALMLAAALPADATKVTMDEVRVDAVQGTPFTFVTNVTNDGDHTWNEVTLTLNVIRMGDGSSRDPEDWDPDWSYRFVGVAAGGSFQVRWSIRTIAGGDYLFFVTVMEYARPAGEGPPDHFVSDTLPVHVEAKAPVAGSRLMPVVLGVPAIPMAGLLLTWFYGRRKP
jgi:hypothetical protein